MSDGTLPIRVSNDPLLKLLEELANNVGGCLYDWDVGEIDRLYEVVSKLKETAREVGAELHAGEEWQG